jgi:hypothetical protein
VLLHWSCEKIKAASDVPDPALLDVLVEKVQLLLPFHLTLAEISICQGFMISHAFGQFSIL